jgi:uncharacterized protein YyaL (SSP411 family)
MTSAVGNIGRIVMVLGGAAVLAAATACRKREAVAERPPAVVAEELCHNRVVGLPGGVYRAEAESPVHWQPWEKASFERARAARRMVFAVITAPQYAGCAAALAELERNPAQVKIINDEYVPVLVDAEAAREMCLLAAELAVEIKKPVQLPMFAWFTGEGHPVAWIPVATSDAEKVAELFDKSHAMVIESWKNREDYVMANSRLDNAGRQARMAGRKNASAASKEPAVDVLRAIRQLTTLYDSVSRSLDEAGGLFPTGAVDVLSAAVLCPSLSADMRARSRRMLVEMLEDLVSSPMFDPLDGGLYSTRRGMSWALPMFERDANRQALAVAGLCRAYQATGDARVLERALQVLAFVEREYGTKSGLFALGTNRPQPLRNWLWTLEEVNKVLPPEDAAWWIAATGMSSLGNLPSESDPKRDFFRCSSFGMKQSMAEIAAGLGLAPEVFKPRYEAARQALLKAREARMPPADKAEDGHAVTTFRMVSAYAAAYCATGTPAYLEKAVALLQRARQAFSEGPILWNFDSKTVPSVSIGRAFLYGLALQACLDVVDVSGDLSGLDWADDLATFAAEQFSKDGFLKECPDDAKVIDLPVTDLTMMFDESSAGLVSSNESRMAAWGRPLVDAFSAQAVPLPLYALERPVLHTDLLAATLLRHHSPVVVMGAGIPPELKTAVARLPLRTVNRRVATPKDEVPPAAVRILWPDGHAEVCETAASFSQALLPSGATRE